MKERSDSESDGSEWNQELHPISYYVDDREQMVEQMFSAITTEKVRKMLPPFLKDIDMSELKADCLIHLLGMSKKRILTIIEGGELHSSSGTESDSTASEGEDTRSVTSKKNTAPRPPKRPSSREPSNDEPQSPRIKSKIDRRSPDRSEKKKKNVEKIDAKHEVKSVEKDKDTKTPSIVKVKKDNRKAAESPKRRSVEASEPESEPKTATSATKKEKGSKSKEETKKKKKKKPEKGKVLEPSPKKDLPKTADNEEDEKGVNLLEILELEMRAEAIRALLQNQDDEDLDVKAELLGLSDIPNASPSRSSKSKNKPEAKRKKKKQSPSPLEEHRRKKISREGVEVISSTTDKQSGSGIPDVIDISADSDESIKGPESEPTWGERWLESTNVKKVVSTSKICANIRKRMKLAKIAKMKEENQSQSELRQNSASTNECLPTGASSESPILVENVEKTPKNENFNRRTRKYANGTNCIITLVD